MIPRRFGLHGIANKPERDVLLAQWRVALLDDDGLDLNAMGVTASLVYCADILDGMPESVGGIQESAARTGRMPSAPTTPT